MKTSPIHSPGTSSDQYRDVQVNTLQLETILPFRLYTEIDGERLLYRRENLPFTEVQKRALLDNQIEILYLDNSEIDRYWEYLQDNIGSFLLAGETLEERSTVFVEKTSVLAEQLLKAPIDKGSLNAAQLLVHESLKFQSDGKEALHSLMHNMQTAPNLYSHSLNVCQYGLALARKSGFSSSDLESLGTGLLFQDLGMLQIPDEVINKNGPLSFEEWDMVKKHPALGLEVLEKTPEIPEISKSIVFSHHERLDGSGYPQGLVASEIPYYVRLASIVDVFTSLTTSRKFRPANNTYEALRIMGTEMAAGLDGNIMKTFIQILGR